MNTIAIIFILAVLTEAIVEYALPFTFPPTWKPAKAYIAMLVGIGLCLFYRGDLPALLGLGEVPYVGPIVTGILISRGANYLNVLVSRLQVVPAPSQDVSSVPMVEDR